MAIRRSAALGDGARNEGPAGKAVDADAVEPGAGAGRRIAVAKLLAELHPEAPEDVPSLVAVGDRPGAPLGIARRHLDDGAIGTEEMGDLVRQVVYRLYTFQAKAHDLLFVAMMDRALAEACRRGEPELDEKFLSGIESRHRRAEEEH